MSDKCLSRLPFNIAAAGRALNRIGGVACQNRIKCGTEVFASGFNRVSFGSAGIELATVGQFQTLIKNIKIRGASRIVSAGHFLRFIIKVGKS